jgi:hypothetical protein
MTADRTNRLTCSVCYRHVEPGESCLIRFRAGQATAVHQHLCFPSRPPRPNAARPSVQG